MSHVIEKIKQQGFAHRTEAGYHLGNALKHHQSDDALVLAIPRGGVPVAAEVAVILRKPIDTVPVRKLGVPQNPELAFGAIGPEDTLVLDQELVDSLALDQEVVDEIRLQEEVELKKRQELLESGQYAAGRTFETIIIVDDGLATGATAQAAIEAAEKQYQPERIVLAVPVAAPSALERLEPMVDEVICLLSTPEFGSVGQYYQEFDQVTNEQAHALLHTINKRIDEFPIEMDV